jgi:SulP family sulfate permease
MLTLAPYAGLIPLASMAPVLMIVSYNMSEHRAFRGILKVRSLSAGVLLITFLLTVLADLTVAVEVGLLLAMMLFVKRMSEIMVVSQVLPDEENNLIEVSDDDLVATPDCPQISIFSIEGPLFFGAAQMFSHSIMNTIQYDPKVIILRMSKVPLIDITGENHLRTIIENLHKRGIIVLIAGLSGQPHKKVLKTGLYEKVGSQHFFPHTSNAITYAVNLIDNACCQTCDKAIFKDCLLSDKNIAN